MIAKLLPVKFVRVVLAKVDEPEDMTFPAVNVPEIFEVVAFVVVA